MFRHKKTAAHLLSVDDLEPLLHLATLCTPALLVSDQGDVWVVGDAVIACTAVNTLSIVIITQVIIATTEAATLFIFKHSGVLMLLAMPVVFLPCQVTMSV